MKKIISVLALALLILVGNTSLTSFAATEKVFDAKTNTPTDYSFTIQFSDEASAAKVKSVQILNGDVVVPHNITYIGNIAKLSAKYDFDGYTDYEIRVVLANGLSYKKAFTTGKKLSELDKAINAADQVLADFAEATPVPAKVAEAKAYVKLTTAIQTAKKALTAEEEQQEEAALTLADVTYAVEEYVYAMDGLKELYEESAAEIATFNNWPTTVKGKLSPLTKIQTDMVAFLKNKDNADELSEQEFVWTDTYSEAYDALYEAADAYFEKELETLGTKFEALEEKFYEYDSEKANYATVEAAYEAAQQAYSDATDLLYTEYNYTLIKAKLDAFKAANTNLDKYI